MKTTYLGARTVPDGYFGKTATAHLCFDPGSNCVLDVYPHGYHRSPAIPDCVSAEEAAWLLEHHPQARRYYS